MRKTVMLFLSIALTSTAHADLAANYKKNTFNNCMEAINSQASCRCIIDRYEHNLDPDVWRALILTSDHNTVIQLAANPEQINYLISIINASEDKMKQILKDCAAIKQ